MDEETERTILRRLSNLETHIINLIHPIQEISSILTSRSDLYELMNILKKPLCIDDSRLRALIREFQSCMEKFDQNIKKFDIVHTYNEIKFIGKKLHQIEGDIEEIKKDGVKRKVDLHFSCDGYELVKTNSEKITSMNTDDLLKELINSLNEREQKAVIHRLGLLGIVPKKTYVALGKVLGCKRERASQIYFKGIRKLRHPSKKNLVMATKNKILIKEVLGKE